MSKRSSEVNLDRIKSAKVPGGYIDKGRILKSKQVSQLIKQLLQEIQSDGVKDKFINAALPDTDTFVKLIEVAKDKVEEVFVENIFKEVAHHIPYNIDEVYLDWQRIDGSSVNSNIEQVLVGVCPKEIVDEYSDLIHSAGFVPKSFEVEALAISRSIFNIKKVAKKTLSNRNIIVIDLGAARSSLIFWREQSLNIDTIEFSVSLPISGLQINKFIEQKLQLTPEQADKFKIKCGLSQDGECKGVLLTLLKPVLQELVKRIRHAIYFHNTYFEGATTHKIILCGGGANLKGLDVYLTNETGLQTELADPFINIKKTKILSLNDALSYCTVIGLGLRDFQ